MDLRDALWSKSDLGGKEWKPSDAVLDISAFRHGHTSETLKTGLAHASGCECHGESGGALACLGLDNFGTGVLDSLGEGWDEGRIE